MNNHQLYKLLFQKFVEGKISSEELERLSQLLEVGDLDEILTNDIAAELGRPSLFEDDRLITRITDRAELNVRARIGIPNQQPRRLSYKSWAWAAAILMVTGFSWYVARQKEQRKPAEITHVLVNDAQPGGNKATLSLANGKRIALDESQEGLSNTDGAIHYTDGSRITEIQGEVQMLTLQTPRKGRYQATLPDGTRVWLNAESKITYPSKFEGQRREVFVEGEVYFEVAKDKSKKFIVAIPHDRHIEVLGTHFNINAYADLKRQRTTLLEGSVRYYNENNRNIVLRPGQQAVQTENKDAIQVAVVNTDVVMAWKNNKFNFEGLRFEEIMSQLARWYDIKIVYKRSIPEVEFYGELNRDNTLQFVLKALRDADVQFKFEGNTLTVY